MTPDEFRHYGHQLIDWIAAYRRDLEGWPVMAAVKPGEIRARLPPAPPERAEPVAAVLDELESIIMPGLTHWQSPRFFGFFPANSALASVLGDLASSGLGVLGLSWQASPALTELEEVMTDWLRQLLGLSDAWRGVIQDTASASTLVALLCARERTTGFSQESGGIAKLERPLVVYASSQSHSSVEKAALLAGFGREQVRALAVDQDFAMRPEALAAAIEADLRTGLTPCAVVATTGTTATTAVDPLEPLGELARRHQIWLHVDAAMAGAAQILEECRWMWRGIEAADSLVLNPHKWLGAVFDCSLYFVRDEAVLTRVMSTHPSYLRSSADSEVRNLRDWGLPLGRRFRALKLWFLLREQGAEGLRARLRRDLENARWLAGEIAAAPDWRLLAPVVLQTLCVRHEPGGLDGEALDRHTLAWVERINRGGAAYLTPAQLQGRWMARVSIGAESTERRHVEALWQVMRQAAQAEPFAASH